MAETKLTNTPIPKMAPAPEVQKLGILSAPVRKMLSRKLDPMTLDKLRKATKNLQQNHFHGITQTDLLEAAMLHFFDKQMSEQLILLKKYGVSKG